MWPEINRIPMIDRIRPKSDHIRVPPRALTHTRKHVCHFLNATVARRAATCILTVDRVADDLQRFLCRRGDVEHEVDGHWLRDGAVSDGHVRRREEEPFERALGKTCVQTLGLAMARTVAGWVSGRCGALRHSGLLRRSLEFRCLWLHTRSSPQATSGLASRAVAFVFAPSVRHVLASLWSSWPSVSRAPTPGLRASNHAWWAGRPGKTGGWTIQQAGRRGRPV